MSDPSPQFLLRLQSTFGGGASILILFHHLRRPLTVRQVALYCGVSAHSAGRHLQNLKNLGLVTYLGHKAGYELATVSLADPTFDPEQLLPDSAAVVVNHNLNTLTTTALTADSQSIPPAPANQPPKPAGQPNRRTAASQALKAEGVGEPKRSQLARLPHVTPEYIERWVKYLRQTRTEGYGPGLLIHLLQQGDDPPRLPSEKKKNSHPKSCSCRACVYGSYICPECFSHPCVCEPEETYVDEGIGALERRYLERHGQ
jgi:hypothetical protein